METVTINITRANLIADMRVKSHAEVSSIEDEKLRYLTELGTEKLQEANQCITDVVAEIHSVLRPFLSGFSGTETSTDNYDTTNAITFVLSVSARKSPGLAKPLTDAVHAYIVDSALDKFYTAVSSPAFAEKHRAKLPAALTVINSLIYRKQEPVYVED